MKVPMYVKHKKLTEGEEEEGGGGGGEERGGGGGGGGGEGGEEGGGEKITSSRCKLFCSLFVVQLISYRELYLCLDGSIRTVALGQQSGDSSSGT